MTLGTIAASTGKWLEKPLKLISGETIKKFILKPEQREHDKTIFLASEKILSNRGLAERELRDRLEEIVVYGSYRTRLLSTEDYCRYFELPGNQFLDSKIKESSLKYCKSLMRLINFLADNFSPSNKGDISDDAWQISFAKLQNLNSEDKKYKDFRHELENRVDETVKRHAEYRTLVKNRLLI